jgi:hypothetical protein
LGYFALSGQTRRPLNAVRIWETPEGRVIPAMFEVGKRCMPDARPPVHIYRNLRRYKGKGEGSLIAAAKVYFDKKDKNTANIENIGMYPAKLAGVCLETK